MKSRVSLFALAMAMAPAVLYAQAAPMNVLTIGIESVKPGQGGAHDKLEDAWASAMYAAKPAYGYLAMKSLSGTTQVWYASLRSSWADYEKSNNTTTPAEAAVSARFRPQESELLSDTRDLILVRIDSLGYGKSRDVAQMRYMSATRISVRLGHYDEWAAARMVAKHAHETAQLSDTYSIWQVVAGAPAGTYYLLAMRKSLAELDEAATIHGPAYQAAIGAEGQKKLDAAQTNAVAGSQTDQFAFAPSQSVMSPEMTKSDPAYWAHKPAAVKKP